jgi:hypothetical protein
MGENTPGRVTTFTAASCPLRSAAKP